MLHFFIYDFLILFSNMIWSDKNGYLSIMSIPTSIFGHVPISALKLNASIYLYNISITSSFSSSIKQVLSRFMYYLNISLSDIYFLSSESSNYGYFSPLSKLCSFLKVLIKLLNYMHTLSAESTHNIYLIFVELLLVLFCNTLVTQDLISLMLLLG